MHAFRVFWSPGLSESNHLGASGGQSGWLFGCAALNAGWFSRSRSMRRMLGNGLKSTWNLITHSGWEWAGWPFYHLYAQTFGRWRLAEWGSSLPRWFRPQHNICQQSMPKFSPRLRGKYTGNVNWWVFNVFTQFKIVFAQKRLSTIFNVGLGFLLRFILCKFISWAIQQ